MFIIGSIGVTHVMIVNRIMLANVMLFQQDKMYSILA